MDGKQGLKTGILFLNREAKPPFDPQMSEFGPVGPPLDPPEHEHTLLRSADHIKSVTHIGDGFNTVIRLRNTK